jgi:predicted transposase
MKLIAQVKLLATPEQAQMLRQTLEQANAACNYVSQQAWEAKSFRQFPLHKLTECNPPQAPSLRGAGVRRVCAGF